MVARGRNCCGARLLTGYVTSPFTGTLATTTLSLGELSRVGYCITLNGRPLNGHPPSTVLEGVRDSTGFCVDVKSVKCFERSNGLDTALYKNYLYLFCFNVKHCAHGWIGRVAPPHDAFLRPIYSCAGRGRAI